MYIYTYIHTYTYIYIHTYVRTYIHTYTGCLLKSFGCHCTSLCSTFLRMGPQNDTGPTARGCAITGRAIAMASSSGHVRNVVKLVLVGREWVSFWKRKWVGLSENIGCRTPKIQWFIIVYHHCPYKIAISGWYMHVQYMLSPFVASKPRLICAQHPVKGYVSPHVPTILIMDERGTSIGSMVPYKHNMCTCMGRLWRHIII